MKNCLCGLVCVSLAVFLFTGCGGENADFSSDSGTVPGGGVSASAVSGSAVSSGAVSSAGIEEKKLSVSGKKNRYNWFCSDTNFYYMRTQMQSGFVERNLETGTEREIEREYFEDLCYVDEDWVYYATAPFMSGKSNGLYRAPIEDGRVNIKKEERLLSEKSDFFQGIYCDGRYILYGCEKGYRKYDLKKKKDIGNYYNKKRYEDSTVLAVVDGYAYINLGDEGLYRQKLDTEEVIGITTDEIYGTGLAVIGKYVYYSEEEASCIMGYNAKDGDKGEAVSEKQIEEVIQRENLLNETERVRCVPGEHVIDRMFVRGDRLYIQVDVGWEKFVQNGGGGYYCSKMVMFSMEAGEGSELHYEKELSECMLEEELYGGADSSRGKCVGMTDEKCYIQFRDHVSERKSLGCYDFESGQLKYLTPEDMEWYLPWYVASHCPLDGRGEEEWLEEEIEDDDSWMYD